MSDVRQLIVACGAAWPPARGGGGRRCACTDLVLRTARIRYPGSAEEWEKDVNALNRGRPMSWAIQDGSFTLLGEEST